jgi:hypothetical protein
MTEVKQFEAKIRVSRSEVFPDKVLIEIKSREIDTEVYDDYKVWKQFLEK